MSRQRKTPTDLADRYYSEPEAAAILGIAVGTLRNRITAGEKHPPFRKVGAAKWFDKAEFWKWFDKTHPNIRAS